MNFNEPESAILAEWVLDRFARHRSDAQNVELEAYAEEREAEAYSRDLNHCRQPHPTLRDLLATSEFMLDLTDRMLRFLPPNSPDAEFVTKLRARMREICLEILAQIYAEPPVAVAAAPR